MAGERVKVVCMKDEQFIWTKLCTLWLLGTGPDALLMLDKAETLTDTVSLKARSVGAALRKDPENAIKAGITSAGVSIGKALLGAITGKSYHYIRYDNPYAKDFGREVRHQEIQKKRVINLWTQRLDELKHAKQDRRTIELTTDSKEKFQITFLWEKDATKLMDAISAAWNGGEEKEESGDARGC